MKSNFFTIMMSFSNLHRLFIVLLLLQIDNCIAQNLYEINLQNIQNDVLPVKLTLQKSPSADVVSFSFAAIVPGTYGRQDYGRFVLSLKARSANGKSLPVKKQGNNTYLISSAKELKYLEYELEDIMDRKVKKNPIFSPGSTNFLAGKNFLFNNGGIFGFFEGEEKEPVRIKITKPTSLYGATSLRQTEIGATHQIFEASSYHQLVDSPIMFSAPDTAQFYVGKTKVTLAVYDVRGVPRAKSFYQLLKRHMEAIDAFLPDLPVDNYTFLFYVDDLRELGDVATGKLGLFKMIWLMQKIKSLGGIGALEHGNSSTYYMADFGTKAETAIKEISLEEQLSSSVIHEFLHIITPLGLHSERIGNYNYINPVMSKHLWLYEGVTEYFANLIKYEGGIYSADEYLQVMESKLIQGLNFPIDKISFTEMSARVLEDQYQKHYTQVYERGAVLAFLLDAEIQRLTKGQKKLIDVMLTLNARYGANKSFDEETFIAEFVKEVHPDLAQFFTLYIEGKTQIKPNDQLNYFGIAYHQSLSEMSVLNPLNKVDNDIQVSSVGLGFTVKVSKVGPKEWAGLKPGDIIEVADYRNIFDKPGQLPKEGTVVQLRVKRKEEYIALPITVRYGSKQKANVLRWMKK